MTSSPIALTMRIHPSRNIVRLGARRCGTRDTVSGGHSISTSPTT